MDEGDCFDVCQDGVMGCMNRTLRYLICSSIVPRRMREADYD